MNIKFGIRGILYLFDDFFFVGKVDINECLNVLNIFLELVNFLGVFIKLEKNIGFYYMYCYLWDKNWFLKNGGMFIRGKNW